MKAIILAGGRGTRLPYSASNIPKALVKLGNRCILDHQIDLLEKHGFSDIRLALNYKANKIIDHLNERYGDRYDPRIELEPLGTGGAIKFASQDIDEPFMVLNGDIISDVDLAAFADNHPVDHNSLVIAKHKQNTDYGLINIDDAGRVKQFLEKPMEPTDGHVNVGFYILQPDIFRDIPQDKFSIEHEIFPKLARSGRLHSFLHNGFWNDLGTEERLADMRAMFSRKSDITRPAPTSP